MRVSAIQVTAVALGLILGEYRRVTITCIPFGTMVAVSTDEGARIHECPVT